MAGTWSFDINIANEIVEAKFEVLWAFLMKIGNFFDITLHIFAHTLF